jgi:hypothetical protein
METQKNSNGWQTLFGHWQFTLPAIAALLTWQLIEFFENLCGVPWVCFSAASFALMILGAVLIAYAKLPVYRSGYFLTFGLKSVPDQTRKYYRWGWRVFLFGVLLSFCLFLSNP